MQVSNSSALYFILSTATINKEQTEHASLLDRLLLLDLVAQRLRFLGVLVTNRGLYVEQAEAAHTSFQGVNDLRFVVGFDKIAQIFDPRYYTDKEAALKRLFALAQLLVAPRGSHKASDVVTLMQQPENQPFQSAVHLLPLPTEVRNISSSEIRAAFEQKPAADVAATLRSWLPPEVALFCEETGCYLAPLVLPNGETVDQYTLRCALIDRALELPEKEQQQLRLRALFQLAVSNTPQGQSSRDWLNSPEAGRSPENLLRFQRDLPAAFS
jgi:nicotinic acid mononucleotide adenylyltransferase